MHVFRLLASPLGRSRFSTGDRYASWIHCRRLCSDDDRQRGVSRIRLFPFMEVSAPVSDRGRTNAANGFAAAVGRQRIHWALPCPDGSVAASEFSDDFVV